jgi:multiple sugar transport system substrate-binding protein
LKYIFLGISVILSILGFGTYLSYPNTNSEVPVLYWVTDANPARKIQVSAFDDWLVENGYVTEDGKPMMELRIDSGNRDTSKQIIQGVSGVAGDIMDCYVEQLEAIGLLEDVTESAKKLGFSTDKTYQAIVPSLVARNKKGEFRQYGYPCNVASAMLWVNKKTFEKYGMTPPSKRWTLDDFERIGKELSAKANVGKDRPDVFLASSLDYTIMIRSLGLSVFNETLTQCSLGDERYIKVLKLLDKWTNVDCILPSKSDLESFDTQAGYGGAALQLFNTGNFALYGSGRYGLIGLRKLPEQLSLGVVEPPHGGFPNNKATTRCAAVYKGGEHKELAKLFLAYLASATYNDIIVADADALPPNPAVTKTEAYLRPKDYPNEWGCHEAFSDAAKNISIPGASSPYVSNAGTKRLILMWKEKFESQLCSAEETAMGTEAAINKEIVRTLEEMPRLAPLYKIDQRTQEKVDAYRKAGKKVPQSWVSNPFHLAHGLRTGWILKEEK